jgi:hypothetical protein
LTTVSAENHGAADSSKCPDIVVRLPSGAALTGANPIVVIGPNGSGKTRQARQLTADVPIAFVNALRNTRVAPELPATGVQTARAQFTAQRSQAQGQHWELSSEFDSMLTQLFAEAASADVEFARRFRRDPSNAGTPADTVLYRLELLWQEIFPGRELLLKDWRPVVASTTSGGTPVEYSGHQMSDGEKAALYLAGRVLSADPGVLVIDEPETHLHSLLAARLWDALESARPDIRFVYITHDLTFALSRSSPQFLLSSPTRGFEVVELADNVPHRLAGTLLGAASLSFYASRVVFCEGDLGSLDSYFYSAWFSGRDTVVRPVDACEDVLRCVVALRASEVAASLESIGIIDRDYRPDRFLKQLPDGVWTLPFHELESMLATPDVAELIAVHVGSALDRSTYLTSLRASVSEKQIAQIILRRWRVSVEPLLQGVAAGIDGTGGDIENLITQLPALIDPGKWAFDPVQLMSDERVKVEKTVSTGSAHELLALVPGKQMLPLAAKACGVDPERYFGLIISSLGSAKDDSLHQLGVAIAAALSGWLPARNASEPPPADALPPAV